MAKAIKYNEPVDFFPEDLRKKYQLGEFAPKEDADKKPAKKTVKKTQRRKAK